MTKIEHLNAGEGCGGMHGCHDRTYDGRCKDCKECKKDADDAIDAFFEDRNAPVAQW